MGNMSVFTKAFLPNVNADELVEANLETTTILAKTPMDEGIRRVTVHITGYSSTPDQTDDTPFITAANTHVRDGIVAANFLPLYTRIKIPELFGEKVFVVEDRMNRRFQDRVDIWFPDRESAIKFGIKRAEIVVL
jgi:3D (Asp-Asp-Asp) domain-containing protein